MRRTLARGVQFEDFGRAGSVKAGWPAAEAVCVSLALNIGRGTEMAGASG